MKLDALPPANQWAQPAVRATISAAWLVLVSPALRWASGVLLQRESRLNLVLVIAFLGASAALWRRASTTRDGARESGPAAGHRAELAAGLVVAAAAVAFAAAERFVGLHRVSALPAALGTWGVLGLWVDAASWRAALLPSLLLTACLPFATPLETYLGFPVRLASADMARGLLAFAGWRGVERETMLVFENRAAVIEVPCSGMRGLWAGAVLALGATWLLRRRCGGCWLAALVGYALLLFGANSLRIALLTAVGVIAEQPLLAETLHVPLGLCGFAASSMAFLAALRRLPARRPVPPPAGPPVSASRTGLAGAGLLVSLLVAGTLVCRSAQAERPGRQPSLAPAPAAARATHNGQLSNEARATSTTLGMGAAVPLSTSEQRFFAAYGASRVTKERFSWRGGAITGSLLVVISDTFRAQHPPEQCYAGAGLSVVEGRTVVDDGDEQFRLLRLARHAGPAVYWFQSPRSITADYGARVWQGLRGEGPWAQVSILFDGALNGGVPDPVLLASVRHAVRTALSGDSR